MKLREEFYELFKNASKSDIEKAISLLSESDKDLLIYLWGQDKKQREMNTKQAEDLIKNVNKRLYKRSIYDKFEGYDKEKVKNLVVSLPPKDKEALLKEYSLEEYEFKNVPIARETKDRNYKTLRKIEAALISKKEVFHPELYKKNLYKRFEGYDKKNIELLVADLDEESRNNLLMQYSFSFTEPRIEDLPKRIKELNYLTLSRIKNALKNNKTSFKRVFTNKEEMYKKFYDQLNFDKEVVNKVLLTLDYEELGLLKLKYGENLEEIHEIPVDINSRITMNILRKIRNRAQMLTSGGKMVTIFDYTNIPDIDEIRRVVSNMPEYQKKGLYKCFGEDLTKSWIFKETDSRVLLNKAVMNKLNNEPKKRSYFYQPLMASLKGFKKENETDIEFERRVKEIIEKYFSEEEKLLLQKKFGKNLDETGEGKDLTKDEKYLIGNRLVFKIRYYLKDKNEVYCKKLFDRFSEGEKEALLVLINDLPEEDKTLLQKKYGANYDKVTLIKSLSKEENLKVKRVLSKLTWKLVKEYTNKDHMQNYDELSGLSKVMTELLDQNKTYTATVLFSLRSILRMKEYEKLKSVYGEKESLAILLYVYGKSKVNIKDIENLTGFTEKEILEYTNSYLNDEWQNVLKKIKN